MAYKSEDIIRQEANKILNLVDSDLARSGVGQLTSWKSLGFKNVAGGPDGWYLPKNTASPAIVVEFKANNVKLGKGQIEELLKNCEIVAKRYSFVIGILYNGEDIIVYKNDERIEPSPTLQPKEYYLKLFSRNRINKQHIYGLTQNINDCLHFKFGIKNLYHRMIITACALVAKRYGGKLEADMNYKVLSASIEATLEKAISSDLRENAKLKILIDVFKSIDMNMDNNQDAIDDFIDWVGQISDNVNSDYWNGEDVMGIFFNEFNRFKKKTESGQVFTPDHITSLMYRLIDVHANDRVLDATCGSGAFLVKAMCNMVKEVGGINALEAANIKAKQLYGIEFDKEIYALACANMLIHKDGKTNIEHLDARLPEAGQWIAKKNISKVLMNPPFERKYGCVKIVENVLDHVPINTRCAFIMPDKKLEKESVDKKYGNKLLKSHTLTTIVKLPENLFFGVSIPASIFIFEAGVPQNGKNINAYYIEEDGFVTVKNKGRHDVHDRWEEMEDYWVRSIYDGTDTLHNTRQILDPCEHLSWQTPEKPFSLTEADFMKTLVDYELYLKGIDVRDFSDRLLQQVLYASTVTESEDNVHITLPKNTENQ